MPRLNRYLLSLLAIAGASFAPIQSYAQSKDVAKTERRTSGQKVSRKKFNTRKFNITGVNKDQKKAIENALQEIYETPTGADLLKRAPAGLPISIKSGEFAGRFQGGYGTGTVFLNPTSIECRSLASTLNHELRHSVQLREGRTAFGKMLEGLPRFVVKKLTEVETELFDVVFALEKGLKNDLRARFYEELKGKYQKEGCDDKEADKLARTEYVRVLWESSPEETKGPEEFSAWTLRNQTQLSRSLTGPVRRRNLKAEYDTINKYVKAMGVDPDVLDVAYFMDMDHIYLNDEQRALLESREAQAQKMTNGSCTKYCRKRSEKGAVTNPDKAVAPRPPQSAHGANPSRNAD